MPAQHTLGQRPPVFLKAYELLGVRKIATSSHHPYVNGGVERVNHTMARMLAMVVNELQYNWDEQLPHVEFAYNNLAGATTGLALNGVHMGRVPRLPLTIFERTGVTSRARTISSVKTMP